MNNFDSYHVFDSLDQARLIGFLQISSMFIVGKEVIKVDKGKILRLYFKHICVLLLLSVFPGKLPLCGQSE